MRVLLFGFVLAMASPAQAGHVTKAGTYQIENCVKVYRHGPTAAQKQADLIRYQHALATQKQEALNKAALRQQQARQSAFERGFAQGRLAGANERQDTRRHTHSHRNRYGRRYTTGFFGNRFGSFNRPVQLGRRTRPHKH